MKYPKLFAALLAAAPLFAQQTIERQRSSGFNIKDPDGHIVEIVEYEPDSWTAREAGKFMPPTRISDHIMHVGVLVGDLDKSMAFYHGLLGFNEFWRGSSSPKMLSWVNMR